MLKKELEAKLTKANTKIAARNHRIELMRQALQAAFNSQDANWEKAMDAIAYDDALAAQELEESKK